jgi:hypothetical protein
LNAVQRSSNIERRRDVSLELKYGLLRSHLEDVDGYAVGQGDPRR